MHTPEQAKSLWCPMSRVTSTDRNGKVVVGQSVFNRLDLDGAATWPNSANCIGDMCAMWRWEHTTASVPTVVQGAGGQVARTYETKTVKTHGYCGLAGTPWSASA